MKKNKTNGLREVSLKLKEAPLSSDDKSGFKDFETPVLKGVSRHKRGKTENKSEFPLKKPRLKFEGGRARTLKSKISLAKI
jgi:hypothetical protein